MSNNYLKTDLMGKINNLPNFYNEALLPVFEAVVNSIHAIQERGNYEDGEITIKIIREKNLSEFFDKKEEELISICEEDERLIKNIEIIDNGIGFNTANFDSFRTSDSTYKLERGGKGIGRFFWLKAFNRVEIESVYVENSEKKKRFIKFSSLNGIEEKSEIISHDIPQITIVRLTGFFDIYRKQNSAYKTPKKIAQRILEHCLSYFIGGIAPLIKIIDGNINYSLNDFFYVIKDQITSEEINIKGIGFQISHIKLYATHKKAHNMVFCADNRDVKEYSIDSFLGTSSLFDDKDEKFVYLVYVSSTFLDKYVNSTRRDFDLPKKGDIHNFDNNLILSIETIKKTVIEKSFQFLSEYLDSIRIKKTEIITDYVSANPSLRSVVKYCPNVLNEIEINSPVEKINEVLYKYKGETEYKIKIRHSELLKTQKNSIEEIKELLHDHSQKIEDLNRDQLADYVLFRKMILDLLEKKLQLNENGKYYNESIIHDIILPRKTSTCEINYEDHNLWIIDELLTFHQYALSDVELKKNSSSNSDNRPDIIIYHDRDDDYCSRAVSIIEFKKPQRVNFDKDPVSQMYDIVRMIKNQKVKLFNGRDLFVNDATKFYCYAICDINDNIHKFAENGNYSRLRGELGYYNYNTNLSAHTEILAFDKIISESKKRHKIFFEKLGL